MLNSISRIFSIKGEIESSRQKLYQAAYSWCHDRSLAEDLVQECLLKALASKSGLRELEYLDTWLFRILINTWHDYLKKKRNVENLDDHVFTSVSDVEKDYLTGELVTRVRQEVSKLPIALREVITLSDFSGFGYQEIGDIMGIPIGTVMSRLYRARKSLTVKLLDSAETESGVQYLRKVK